MHGVGVHFVKVVRVSALLIAQLAFHRAARESTFMMVMTISARINAIVFTQGLVATGFKRATIAAEMDFRMTLT